MTGPAPLARKFVREIGGVIYPGLVMVRIVLPPDVHRRLLEALPGWSQAHKLLSDATEMHYAVGVRRVSCTLPDALALLHVAERVYPESAPLIRIAIREARSTYSPVPRLPPELRRLARDLPPPQPLPLRRLAGLHFLVLTFPVLHFLDRVRELLRRLV
jgi:hypothetical protein